MPFHNSINYAAIFNRILDEKFYILPRTMWMENTNPGIEWQGGKEIKIPMLGKADSLNASVSAAILLYEAVRQRQRK